MTTQPSNAITLAQLKQIAFDCGGDKGKGDDAQIKFGLQVVAAAYQGSIDLDRNKHGTDMDDATVLAAEYFRGRTGNTVFDAKAGNQRKLIACTRTLTKLGGWPKGGNGEPLATVNSLMTHRQNMRKDPTKAKKLDDAFNTLMRYARQQIRQDQLVTDDAFDSFCYRKSQEVQTLEEHYEAIRNAAIKVKQGKASSGTVIDKAPEITTIIDACNKRLRDLANAKANGKPGAPSPKKVA